MRAIRRDVVASVIGAVVFTVLFGLAYPLIVTGISQVAFPDKADGSQIEVDGRTVGSRLIGQDFRRDRRYFQSRPSATGEDPAGTFFNNLGPNSAELRDQFAANLRTYLRVERPYNSGLTAAKVPADAVQTSASGVDPHISERNAGIQARRVARVRRVPLSRVRALVSDHTDGRSLGLLGEPGVNVLELNLALDKAFPVR
jgi:potassium-transporting ATPase KdpC subunit